jgi:hypothetical protein
MRLTRGEEEQEDHKRGDRQNGPKATTPAKAWACRPRPAGAINLVAVALVHPCCAPLTPLYQHNDTKAMPPTTPGQALVSVRQPVPRTRRAETNGCRYAFVSAKGLVPRSICAFRARFALDALAALRAFSRAV